MTLTLVKKEAVDIIEITQFFVRMEEETLYFNTLDKNAITQRHPDAGFFYTGKIKYKEHIRVVVKDAGIDLYRYNSPVDERKKEEKEFSFWPWLFQGKNNVQVDI